MRQSALNSTATIEIHALNNKTYQPILKANPERSYAVVLNNSGVTLRVLLEDIKDNSIPRTKVLPNQYIVIPYGYLGSISALAYSESPVEISVIEFIQ